MSDCCEVKKKENSLAKLIKYWPLLLIVILSLCLSQVLYREPQIKAVMGFSFVFLAFLKCIDLAGFVKGFKNYDPLTRLFTPLGYLYPFFELLMGFYLLSGFVNKGINLFGAAMLLLTGAGILYQKFIKKRSFACACMGSKVDVPLGAISLFENFFMALILILMVI